MTQSNSSKSLFKNAGIMLISGAVCMFIGAGLWASTGTDLWQALDSGDLSDYLARLPAHKTALVANTAFWSLGVLLMGTGGYVLTMKSKENSMYTHLARTVIRTAPSMAIVAFLIMLSLVVHQPSADVAFVIGWIGARTDDVATLLIIGIFPLCVGLGLRGGGLPRWLTVLSYVAALGGLLSLISLFTGISALGFIIIPLGLVWMISAGVVMVREG